MRKLLYTFAALAGMLAVAASCQRETPEGSTSDGDLIDVSMNFTVDDGRPATKAIGDGSAASKLAFYAYDEKGNYLPNLKPVSGYETLSDRKGTVKLKVIKGMKYQFVFVAYSANAIPDLSNPAGNDYFVINPSSKILTVRYDKIAKAQNEASDLFYTKIDHQFDASGQAKDVTLKRVMAQLNVGSTTEDFDVATNSGIDTDALKTGYNLTSIPNTLGLLDGSVSGAADITLGTAIRPTETLTVGGADYTWVSTAYVLVDGTTGQTTDVTLNVEMTNRSDDALSPIFRTITAVPLKRNYRTNILGNIFSIDAVFKVEVSSDFNTPDINETLETSIAKANEMFAAGLTSVTVDLAPTDGDATTIKLPATTDDVRLNLNIVTDETITIQYASNDPDKNPAHVEIYASRVKKLVANLTSTTVTISSGSYIDEGDFATAPTTLIIEEGAVVGNLTVRAGTVKVYGSITGKFTATGEATGTVVECPLPAGETTMPTSINTPMNIVGEQDADGNNLTSVKVSSATSIKSADVVVKNIDIVGNSNISVSTSSSTFENVNIDTGYNGGLTLYGTAAEDDDIMLFKNVSIVKSFKALHIFHTGTVKIEDCFLDAVYPINCNGSKGNMIVKNTTLRGWTSYNNGNPETYTTTFDNCVFGASEYYGYAFTRPYNSTVYTNCEFEEGFAIGGSTSNCKDETILTLEFKNCTYKGQPFTVNNNCIIMDNMAVGKHQIIIDGVKYHFAAEGLLVDENGAANMSVTSNEDLTTAINEIASNSDIDKVNIALAEETYTISGSLPSDKEVSFEGKGENTVLSMINTVNTANNADLSFKNLTIKSGNDNYKGFQHAASAVYENVTFYGRRTLYELQATFNNCTFIQETYDYNFGHTAVRT